MSMLDRPRSYRRPEAITGRGEKRRERIVAVAAELFLEKGFERVTMDEIASLSGGSKTGVYENFGDKAGVFQAAMEKTIRETEIDFSEVSRSHGSITERLVAVAAGASTVAVEERNLRLYRLAVSESLRFPAIMRHWQVAVLGSFEDTVEQLLAPARSADARRLAELFCSAVLFPPLHAALSGETIDRRHLDRMIQNAADLLTAQISSFTTETS